MENIYNIIMTYNILLLAGLGVSNQLTCIYLLVNLKNKKDFFHLISHIKMIFYNKIYFILFIVFLYLIILAIRFPILYIFINENIALFPSLLFCLFSSLPLLVYSINIVTQLLKKYVLGYNENLDLSLACLKNINSNLVGFSLIIFLLINIAEILDI